MHRCLQRNNLNKLPKDKEKTKTRPEKKIFKKYKIGYFHIDICEICTAEVKVYLYVAIDRTCKYIYAEVYPSPTSHVASLFLKNLIFVVPYKIHKVLTDNGLQFSLKLMKRGLNYQSHAFEQVCQEYNIEHRLTQFKHP